MGDEAMTLSLSNLEVIRYPCGCEFIFYKDGSRKERGCKKHTKRETP